MQVETLEDRNTDEEQEEIELQEKDGASAGVERGRWADLIAQNTWYNIIPNGRVSFRGLYQRKILEK